MTVGRLVMHLVKEVFQGDLARPFPAKVRITGKNCTLVILHVMKVKIDVLQLTFHILTNVFCIQMYSS